MSTRANIIITDGDSELIFYRHSDGYPEGTMPTLEKFLRYVTEGRIRDNTGQAAGWLIVLGREEYAHHSTGEPAASAGSFGGPDWKVGSIEPTTLIHGDIEYLYVVDLRKREIRHSETGRDGDYNATVPKSFYSGAFAKS